MKSVAQNSKKAVKKDSPKTAISSKKEKYSTPRLLRQGNLRLLSQFS